MKKKVINKRLFCGSTLITNVRRAKNEIWNLSNNLLIKQQDLHRKQRIHRKALERAPKRFEAKQTPFPVSTKNLE